MHGDQVTLLVLVYILTFLDSAAWERFSQGISPIRPRSAGAEEEGDEEFGMYFKRLKTIHFYGVKHPGIFRPQSIDGFTRHT